MNDSMSVLLATAVLALGGFGLYMYKSSDKNDSDDNDSTYNEDSLFGGSSSFFGWDNNEADEDLVEEEPEDFKPRKRGTKTQRNRKAVGNSRRRY